MGKQDEIRERVMELIESLEVGQAIPSERRLCEQLGVSRLTLRAALDDLVREGHLTRRQGSGTYVSRPKIAQPLTLTSFSEDMRRRGMVPGSRTLELRTVPAGARLGRRLQLSPEALVVRVMRLRLADGEPMALEVLHVPAALVPGLTQADLENRSFYELMEERYGVVISSATQTIEPTVTSAEESEALGVPLHSPAFLFERTTLTTSGQPMEFVRSFYRGDRYQLVTELLPSRSRNGRVTLADARSFATRPAQREEDMD
ncbi:MAG TPA: GntR family transcriptional regulator [Candidatus Dormibacteraeota bacterium]